MSVEENIQLIRRWFQEVWNENKIQTVYDLLAPDAVGRGQTGSQGEIHGPKDLYLSLNRFVRPFRTSMSKSMTRLEPETRLSRGGPRP